jgi:hypothetical protein
MRVRSFLMIDAVVASGYGLALLLMPVALSELYHARLDPAGELVSRLFGSALVGFGVINWFMRNSRDRQAMRAVLAGNFISDVLGFVIGLLYQLTGPERLNQPGWPTVIMYFALMCGFGYFLLANEK